MRIPVSLLFVCLLLLPGHVAAQPAPEGEQVRIRGSVLALEGDMLTVNSKTFGDVALTLLPNAGINGLEKKNLSDITDGVFIGTTAAKGSDGRWQATEVHLFPEEMRGAGEGHYPWDTPGTTMTNADVTGTAKSKDGRTLQLTYEGGQVEVDVAPGTPIVAFIPGDRSLLKPGAQVFILAMAMEDGSINAFAVVAETNGVKPPM